MLIGVTDLRLFKKYPQLKRKYWKDICGYKVIILELLDTSLLKPSGTTLRTRKECRGNSFHQQVGGGLPASEITNLFMPAYIFNETDISCEVFSKRALLWIK